MKLTAKLAELRIDSGDGAIDDHYVAGPAQPEDSAAATSNNIVYDGYILAHRWARKRLLCGLIPPPGLSPRDRMAHVLLEPAEWL
ncbi:hypothetical protein NKI95_23170 [Mesorhizobium sp. M0306]|uniref:hypothetical protein n=1 Tax=Mesorhizobium sp. M0306 TaxID=2956932 RepID=UPI003339E6B9